jgi:hypothetical protein
MWSDSVSVTTGVVAARARDAALRQAAEQNRASARRTGNDRLQRRQETVRSATRAVATSEATSEARSIGT